MNSFACPPLPPELIDAVARLELISFRRGDTVDAVLAVWRERVLERVAQIERDEGTEPQGPA